MQFLCRSMCALVFIFGSADILFAADWPGFRGDGGGVAPDKNLPVKITKENILWKIKLPGPGASSPITSGNKVFVTAYSGYGTKIAKGFGFGFGKGGFGKGGAGDQKKLKLHLICLDRGKGDVLWQKHIEPKLPEQPFRGFITQHGYTSSTPVTDGERVYAFFGKSGVIAFDLQGKQLWRTSVGAGTDQWGSASSPVLYKDVLIVPAMIESGALVGLDKNSGKELWRVKGLARRCWTSPVLVETKDGKHEVVLSVTGQVAGYDPESGKELWHCEGIGRPGGRGYLCSTPVAKEGVVYVVGGGGPGTPPVAMAIRAGGSGDVTGSHIIWKERAGTNIASPVLSGNHLFWVSGTARCLNAGNGKEAYAETLYGARQEYVSPVAAGDAIYALTRLNGLYVLASGGKYQPLDHFEFEDDESIFNASPAISDGRMYLRSNAYLYCVGKK